MLTPSFIPSIRRHTPTRPSTAWTVVAAQRHCAARLGTRRTTGSDHPDLRRHESDPKNGDREAVVPVDRGAPSSQLTAPFQRSYVRSIGVLSIAPGVGAQVTIHQDLRAGGVSETVLLCHCDRRHTNLCVAGSVRPFDPFNAAQPPADHGSVVAKPTSEAMAPRRSTRRTGVPDHPGF